MAATMNMPAKRKTGEIEVTASPKCAKKRKQSPTEHVPTKNLDTVLSGKLPDDMLVKTWDIDDTTRMSLKLDQVFGAFYLILSKTTKDGVEKVITLSDEEMAKLQSFGGNILTLLQRYSGNGRHLNFTLSLTGLLKVKIDFSGFTSVDIRRYFLTPDDTMAPTRNGVRIPEKSVASLFDALKIALKIVRDMTEKTVNIVRKSKLALMVREIAELEKQGRIIMPCEACEIGDPSQDHHICLTVTPDWAECVETYSKVVEKTINPEDVLHLAEKVGRKMNTHLVDAPTKICQDDPEDKLFMSDQRNFAKDKVFASCAKLIDGEDKKTE